MSLFGEQIKKLRIEKKLTQAELAEAIGVSQSYYSKLEKKEHEPAADTIVAASNFFNVSTDLLLTGIDRETVALQWMQELTEEDKKDLETFLKFLKFRRNENNIKNAYIVDEDTPIAATKEDNIIYLPILGNAAAGIPIEIIELPQGEVPVSEKHKKYNSFIVRAQGDSMIGAGIDDGDLVIIRPQPVVENGEIALVNVDGSATIKYFYMYNGQCELRSANPRYDPICYSRGNISILGKVVEIIKQI